MKKVIDTQTTNDPEVFGETLREYVFVQDKYGGDFGCYSTFDVRPEFQLKECPPRIAELLMGASSDWHPFHEWEKDRKKRCVYRTNGEIVVAWYWDGDGTLYFKEGDREAINNDCKKGYGWEWVEQEPSG